MFMRAFIFGSSLWFQNDGRFKENLRAMGWAAPADPLSASSFLLLECFICILLIRILAWRFTLSPKTGVEGEESHIQYFIYSELRDGGICMLLVTREMGGRENFPQLKRFAWLLLSLL
jgi:hypothetical protein